MHGFGSELRTAVAHHQSVPEPDQYAVRKQPTDVGIGQPELTGLAAPKRR